MSAYPPIPSRNKALVHLNIKVLTSVPMKRVNYENEYIRPYRGGSK